MNNLGHDINQIENKLEASNSFSAKKVLDSELYEMSTNTLVDYRLTNN